MATDLLGGLTTEMTYAIYGSTSEFGPEAGPRELNPKAIKPKYEARAIYEMFKGVGASIYPVAADIRKIGEDEVYPSLAAVPKPVGVLILCLSREHATPSPVILAAHGRLVYN